MQRKRNSAGFSRGQTELESLDLLSKKSLIDTQAQDLSLSKQCRLVGISRACLYYKPKLMSALNLRILNAMDEIYTNNSDYGYRYIHKQLIEDGFAVGKHRVLKYMKILGIEAVHPKPKKLTSIRDHEHKIYPYLLTTKSIACLSGVFVKYSVYSISLFVSPLMADTTTTTE